MCASAIECSDLVVRYGQLVAVDGLSLAARPGSVLALLGPNGAGKTSTVEALEGYIRPASGNVRVLGLDPVRNHAAVVARIGVMLQSGGVYPTMTPRRILRLFASFYESTEDVEQLLEAVGLTEVQRTPWRRLSGGEKQRLSLAMALIGKPDALFLDEPTSGVDPEGRIAIRKVISEARERGTCIILTTHELAEAERLADDVVILVNGHVGARGTVAELRASAPLRRVVEFSGPSGIDTASLACALDVEDSAVVHEGGGRYFVEAQPSASRLAALAGWFAERDLPLQELSTGRGSFEDVYLQLTRTDELRTDQLSEAPRTQVLTEDPKATSSVVPMRSEDVATGTSSPSSSIRMGARRLFAQAAAEMETTLRSGESLLLTIGIPVVLLVFFSNVHLLPTGTDHPITFLAPGVLAIAVMGTSLVNLSIATGFERGYGVLKRLGSTPLGRPALLGAKVLSVMATEVLQLVVLIPVGLGLGWRPSAGGIGVAVVVVVLATAGFAGLGLLLAGILRPEVNLAAANGLWIVLLLVSGMLAPLSKLPGWLEAVAKALPAAALAEALHTSLGAGRAVPSWAWASLACWALAAPVAAAFGFRWE